MAFRWTFLAALAAAPLLVGCEGGAELPPPEPAKRPALWIEAQAARVTVIPEARADVVATVQGGGLTIGREGLALTVSDGEDATRGAECEAPANPARLPAVVVRAPLDVEIRSVGAVVGEIGPASSLTLASGGCGRWRAARASGPAQLVQAGGGAIELGEAGNGLDVDLAGDGAVSIGRANGLLDAEVKGAGRLTIGEGVNQRAALRLDGPGQISHKGRVGTLRAELDGSGVIDVALVTGQVQRKLQGTGEVNWGRPQGRDYCGGTVCQRRRDARGER